MGPIFAGRGRVISGRLAKRFGIRYGRNAKSLRGVIGPISTPNDYLTTVLNDAWPAAETFPSHGPHGKSFNLLQFSPFRGTQ